MAAKKAPYRPEGTITLREIMDEIQKDEGLPLHARNKAYEIGKSLPERLKNEVKTDGSSEG